MRGFYLLALLATIAAATRPLPENLANMSPYQIDREVRSQVDRVLREREKFDLSRSAMEDAFVEFIYWLQEQMANGFPKFGIPPLDPLYLQRTISYNLTSDLLEVEGWIAQTTIQNTSTFDVTQLDINTVRMQLKWNFTWPEVNVGGLYDVDGTLTLLPIYGTGPFTVAQQILVPIGNVIMNRLNPILAPYTVSQLAQFIMGFFKGTTTAMP
ncbi:hypothetical protein B566_EDAN015055 [Ephemera danica]|nr:hypothetical protein B566_EDAN015055 [Ephemera danica]